MICLSSIMSVRHSGCNSISSVSDKDMSALTQFCCEWFHCNKTILIYFRNRSAIFWAQNILLRINLFLRFVCINTINLPTSWRLSIQFVSIFDTWQQTLTATISVIAFKFKFASLADWNRRIVVTQWMYIVVHTLCAQHKIVISRILHIKCRINLTFYASIKRHTHTHTYTLSAKIIWNASNGAFNLI